MFHRVHTIGGGRETAGQFASTVNLLPQLRREKYDVVIDLQRNALSCFVRRLVHPRSFSEFDRFSANSAGERTRKTINELGLEPIDESTPPLHLRDEYRGMEKLAANGYNPSKFLIVLNPAGSFVTRLWPLKNYLEFALRWKEKLDPDVQFIILGLNTIMEKALVLKSTLGDRLINMVGTTTTSEAFNILRHANLVLSEDSGLLHMAWVAGVPTVALFGSTRSVWSKPLGKRSVCLDSSDLECGECLQPTCQFGDVRCLTRHTSEFVLDVARRLLAG
jgi:ADP-heptose:LPS heptosyltransferase